MTELNQSIKKALLESGSRVELPIMKAFIQVESGGKGFGVDGRLLIQFEPVWFKRLEPYAPSGAWSVNGIERQSKEWEAFKSAMDISLDGAIQATSLGLPQIMGFHYKRLGYESSYQMFNAFCVSLENQIKGLIKFIETDPKLLKALKEQDWHTVASIYNGKNYKQLAERIGREPYDISLRKAYEKYKGSV